MGIEPIQTYYKDYHFRSRLEARWAVFFDALGVKYEYEPEGFNLDNGMSYLPDFLIHDVITRYPGGEPQNIYVEVKGVPNATDAEKIAEFAKYYPVWVVGDIPDPEDYILSCAEQRRNYCDKVINGEYSFDHNCAFCPYCYGMIDGDSCFEFSLAFDDGKLSFHGADSNYEYGRYDEEIVCALFKARGARFEHGEMPFK